MNVALAVLMVRSCGQPDPKPTLLPLLCGYFPGIPHNLPHFDQNRIVASSEIQSADLSPGNDEGTAQFTMGTFQIGHRM
jgi:hypothetical protein